MPESNNSRLSDDKIATLREKGCIDKDGICFALLCAATTAHWDNGNANLTFNLMSWLHVKVLGTDPGPKRIAEAFFRACGQMKDGMPQSKEVSDNKDSVERGILINALHCTDIDAYCGGCAVREPGRGWGDMWDVSSYHKFLESMEAAYQKGLVSRTNPEYDDDETRADPEWTGPNDYDHRLCVTTSGMLSDMIREDDRALVVFRGI